jgi:citrate lyase beta subunit
MPLRLMYITNDPQIALIAENNGVDRIWIDLETIGKEERQKGLNSVKSNHSISDIATIKPLLSSSEMLVRVNPWNENSENEINSVIASGADIIMLPMWKSVSEVECFLSVVNNRVKTTLLLETKEAVECVEEVLKLDFDEIHIGLNDLHLAYGMTFMFELLANGTVETLCNKFKAKGIPYGFGGIAKIGDGMLLAEKIILEHYRLGSTRAILSRTFCDTTLIQGIEEIAGVFELNMRKLRAFEEFALMQDKEALLKNKAEVLFGVNAVVEKMRKA